MIPVREWHGGAYLLVKDELEIQSRKMNALNAAMEYHRDNKVWSERLFTEFGQVSFLVAALDSAKRMMEEEMKRANHQR
jgi:hypothetical protein